MGDQLQEIKAKTSLESRYMMKEAHVQVASHQRRYEETQGSLELDVRVLEQKLALEQQVNSDIENYLKSYQDKLDQKIQYWMSKYDEDLEAKHHELEQLKASRASDLARLQEVTDMYNEMER